MLACISRLANALLLIPVRLADGSSLNADRFLVDP